MSRARRGSKRTKAPSTRIRIFLNPRRFLSGLKNLHVHTLSDLLRIYYFNSTLEGRFNIRIRRMCVDGSQIRKEKVVDSKISGLR